MATSNCTSSRCFSFFFFNDTATTEIYTLSLHDAPPISNLSLLTCPDHRKSLTRARRCTARSEEHTSELQSQSNLVCRLLLEKKITDGAGARIAGPRSDGAARSGSGST